MDKASRAVTVGGCAVLGGLVTGVAALGLASSNSVGHPEAAGLALIAAAVAFVAGPPFIAEQADACCRSSNRVLRIERSLNGLSIDSQKGGDVVRRIVVFDHCVIGTDRVSFGFARLKKLGQRRSRIERPIPS